MSNINNKVLETNKETGKLSKPILLISLTCIFVGTLLGIIFNNYTFVRSFLLGTLGSIFYLRMQVVFVNSFLKRDLLSILMTIISSGRILIILSILLVAFKRTDLFNIFFVISGIVMVHFISGSVFIYKIITNYSNFKKKLIVS